MINAQDEKHKKYRGGTVLEDNQVAVQFDIDLLREIPLKRIYRKSKTIIKAVLIRLIDIVFASIGLVFLIPILALVFLGNLINGKIMSPITYEKRVGKGGKLFKMFKLNSVDGSYQKEFLEKTSIDELPQFINILIGNMAIVGPRPYIKEDLEKEKGYYEYITRIKPGLTGVYQISGRTNISFLDRLDMDTRYYYNKSIWTDLKIVAITLLITTKRKKVGKFADYTYTTIKEFMGVVLKRLIDIVGAIVGIAILIPLTAFVAIVNFISGDRGPIFFTQERIGRYGKKFKMHKFRSMVVDADERLEKLLIKDADARKEWEENHKLQNDPRITKAGKFLRKTSLDEFPNFINVLKGEMSLVGPRAIVDEEVEKFGPLFKKCFSVKPGITGYWAANGRSNTTYDERVKLEVTYAEKHSTKMDVEILAKTIVGVLKKEGAI